MRKLLARLIAPVVVSSLALAADDVITITLDGVNTDVTLRDDGSVFIDKPWPLSNETVQLPGLVVPPCDPPEFEDVTIEVDGEDDAKEKGAGAVAAALLVWWIHCGLELIEQSQFSQMSSTSASMSAVIRPGRLWGQPWVDLVVSLVDPYLP